MVANEDWYHHIQPYFVCDFINAPRVLQSHPFLQRFPLGKLPQDYQNSQTGVAMTDLTDSSGVAVTSTAE